VATLRLPTTLWPNQKSAIKEINRYLESRTRDEASLITMPTGTGKSGVIAWSATRLPLLSGHRLVLTPWTALTEQLEEDIESRFWGRLDPKDKPKEMPPVRKLPPARAIASLGDVEEPTVFVATIAAISTLANRCRDNGTEVSDHFADFDCVFVDEGHYEPAEKWSKAIRALRLPTILLTATPYRDDLKFFEIGDYRYRFPHWEAEAQRLLRRPEFKVISTREVSAFAIQLRDLVSEEFPDDEQVRVIVRCARDSKIEAVVAALEGLGESAIGIHENFVDSERLRRNVPARGSGTWRYWIHQNKLIEGIDDPSFKVVAFYDSPRKARPIVQQIGRVLRNPAQAEDDMKALVVGTGDRDLAQVWDGYRAFDKQEDAESVATTRDLVEELIDSQPESYYFDGDYRVRVDLTSTAAWETFRFPLRARVFRKSSEAELDLESLAESIGRAWHDIDLTVYPVQRPDGRTVIVPYISVGNSPLLRTGIFVEPEFGYTVLRLVNELLFVYDARGVIPPVVVKNYSPVPARELTKLFPQGASGIRGVSLINTDIGSRAARSRQIRAADIGTLAPDLADYGYICTIAEGYVGDKRRYVGLSRARVTDYRSTEGDFDAYKEWIEEIEQTIRSGADAAATFGRYATYTGVPSDPSPIHVLLDVDPHDYARRDEDGKDVPLEMEDTVYPVEDGAFVISVEGEEHEASLTWDGRRYRLSSDLGLRRYVNTSDGGRELIHAINEDQLLRVVPADRGAVYAHGEFFAPRSLKAMRGILSVLTPVARLSSIADEKGKTSTDGDWAADSVFGLISALADTSARTPEPELAAALNEPDFLLCTDLGTEIADFVGIKHNRIALIHAKASSDPSPTSASALHDVVSQAVKNLALLQPFDEVRPDTARWSTGWKADDGGTIPRKRAGNFGSTTEAWKQIRDVIADPQADREVWLVLGQSLSVARLEAELNKLRPAPQIWHIYSLLQTAWAATSQMGARLRIFCSP
jgi:superfamily II DNA or RNA helicase